MEKRHVKQILAWGKKACETNPNMKEKRHVKQNSIWEKDSLWNESQYEGKTAYETKPNKREGQQKRNKSHFLEEKK